MDRTAKIKFPIPEEELVYSGHTACPGCGAILALKYVLKGLGPKTIAVVPPACMGTIIAGFPFYVLNIPVLRVPFASTAITASGVRAALDIMGKKDTHVLAWAGDGGTSDIGIQALSGAAERNDNIIYVCYDNEGYMNTGIQRSSSTPEGAWTTTTPSPYEKDTPKKDIVRIMAAHNIPYVATASIGYPTDLIRKVNKAKEIKGTKFIMIFSPCPTGWRYSSEMTIKMAKLATETGIFPLYEVENGKKYTLSPRRSKDKPVKEYVSVQGRFRNLKEEKLRLFEARVQEELAYLRRLAG
jgi:pyruvate/2-oxoacid:ferredoxin oxidoreductase beta subunit